MGVPYYRSRKHTAGQAPAALAGVGSAAEDNFTPPGYPLEVVPAKAAEVVAWIEAGFDPVDVRARALAALEVENGRPEQRSTVLAAVAATED